MNERDLRRVRDEAARGVKLLALLACGLALCAALLLALALWRHWR